MFNDRLQGNRSGFQYCPLSGKILQSGHGGTDPLCAVFDVVLQFEKITPKIFIGPAEHAAIRMLRHIVVNNGHQLLQIIPENGEIENDEAVGIVDLMGNTCNQKADGCIIVIEDNGCGMDERTMKRIFDPFYTKKTSVQGTGLGLYISQSLAEGLGGRIEVESQPDRGSTFKVILNDL